MTSPKGDENGLTVRVVAKSIDEAILVYEFDEWAVAGVDNFGKVDIRQILDCGVNLDIGEHSVIDYKNVLVCEADENRVLSVDCLRTIAFYHSEGYDARKNYSVLVEGFDGIGLVLEIDGGSVVDVNDILHLHQGQSGDTLVDLFVAEESVVDHQ